MVAKRKIPVAPAPPTSRSTSTQPILLAVKSKQPPSTFSNGASAEARSGEASSKEKSSEEEKSKKTKRTKKAPAKPRASSSRRLYLFFLSIFTIYALSVCPTNHTLSSPVCRSLDAYRTHVLEPYVVPPINAVIHHPLLVPLHPYAQHLAAIEKSTIRPRAFALIAYSKAQYYAHLVPAYNKHIVGSLWRQTLLPNYMNYAYPYIRPYIAYYHIHIAPRCAFVTHTAHTAYTTLDRTVTRVWPHIVRICTLSAKYASRAYDTAKPHAIAAYQHAHPHIIASYGRVSEAASRLVHKVADARREFVDPHVRKVWEKVGEAEAPVSTRVKSAKTEPSSVSVAQEPSGMASASSVIVASVHSAAVQSGPEEVIASSASIAASSQAASSTVVSSTNYAAASSASSSSSEAAASPATAQETPPPVAVPSSSSSTTASEPPAANPASSNISTSLHVPSIPAGGVDAQQVIQNEKPETAADTTPDMGGKPRDKAVKEEAEEVDDFLRQIGLDEQVDTEGLPQDSLSSNSDPGTAQQPPSDATPEVTPEERLAETAAKRADITGRHAVWQTKLNALVVEAGASVREALMARRQETAKVVHGDAVVTAGIKGKGKGADKDKEGVVEGVEGEAGRLIKGLEGYLKTVEEKRKMADKDGDGWGEVEEREKEKWNKVVNKVEERFGEKVRSVQGEVHEWYLGVREAERNEILQTAANVKSFAERAQADIGLDYAWLDDVTYHDWQKYHDLMRTSENFTAELNTLQDTLQPNPLVVALDKLEVEVEDVVTGFGVLVQGLRDEARNGVFGMKVGQDNEHKNEEATMTAPDGDTGAPSTNSVGAGPKNDAPVSILPVPPPPKEEGVVDTEHLFVGRDKEEVESALRDVEVEEAFREKGKREDHVEL